MIRLANTNDINDINTLLYQVHKVHSDARNDIFKEGKKKYSSEDLINILNDKNKPIFVYEENNKVIGYSFCVIKKTTNVDSLVDRVELYIDDLCVDSNYRGKGIGTLLYNHVKEYANIIKANSITLNVWCFNEKALKFYQKLGLTPLKVIMEDNLKATKH